MSMEKPHLARRMGMFLRDFRLENNLQLLFPLGSLLLLIGSSHSWAPPAHALYSRELQAGQKDLWFDMSRLVMLLSCYAAQLAVRFAFFASIVIWCLPVRDPLRKFRRWTLLPIGLGVLFFLGLVFWAHGAPTSIFEPASRPLSETLRAFPGRLLTLGDGFYVTLLGALVTGIALAMVQTRKLPLPVRFRKLPDSEETSETPKVGRSVFTSVIVATIVILVLSLPFFWVIPAIHSNKLQSFLNWPRNFSLYDCMASLTSALVVAICAFVFLGKVQWRSLASTFRPLHGRWSVWSRDCLLGTAIALSVVLVPRFFFKVFSVYDFDINAFDFGGFPPFWGELFLPRPFFWLLLLYVVALLEEIALRGYIQQILARRFGLKRAIFLVGLVWWMLPLHLGTGPWFLGLWASHSRFIGVTTLVSIGTFVAYSVPLGWLYARSGSIVPVALMHGTIILFRKGTSSSLYYTYPFLFWIEMAGWVFVGWFLFKRYPPRQVEASPEAVSGP